MASTLKKVALEVGRFREDRGPIESFRRLVRSLDIAGVSSDRLSSSLERYSVGRRDVQRNGETSQETGGVCGHLDCKIALSGET